MNDPADLGMDFYNQPSDLLKNFQDNDFNDQRLLNIDSITNNRETISDNKVANTKCVNDTIEEGTIFRFNGTFENHPKVSVGNDIYNLFKHAEKQLTDVTEFKYTNKRDSLILRWRIKISNRNDEAYFGIFLKSAKAGSPAADSGATSLPPIGTAFMYIDTSSNNHGHEKLFVTWGRTDIF